MSRNSLQVVSFILICCFVLIVSSPTSTAETSPNSKADEPTTWHDTYLQRIETEAAARTPEAAEADPQGRLLHLIVADLADQYGDIESVRQIMMETSEVFHYAHRGGRIPTHRSLAPLYWAAAQETPGKDEDAVPPGVDKSDVKSARNAYYKFHAERMLEVTRHTLIYVAEAGLADSNRTNCESVCAQIDGELIDENSSADWPSLYTELCLARREILFQHPDLEFERLLVNRHEPGGYSHNCDQYLGRHSRPGRGIAILDDWRTVPQVVEPFCDLLTHGDTARPNLSYDGQRLIFTFCDHSPSNPADRRFFLYEASVDGSSIRQITGDENDSLAGWGGRTTVAVEDFDPCYLPDGSIVFTSTRSQNFGRCHGGRYTPAYLICRCDADGSNIRMISFGEANEHFPAVFHDGRILFTRWEYINRNQIAFHKLWAIRPDGTGVSNFYGVNSASPWANNYHDTHAAAGSWYDDIPTELTSRIHPFMISETRPIPGVNQVVATGTTHHSYTAGSLIRIDLDKGEDGFGPLNILTPETPFPEAEDFFSVPGNYMTPYPLNKSLFLAAYSPYTIQKQHNPVPVGEYMIYLVDMFGGREPIYRESGSCCSPMPIMSRPTPPILPSLLADDANLSIPGPEEETETGTLVVQNVYLTRNDPEGVIEPGQIKHLRVCEVIPQTHPGPYAAGSREDFARKILGTVPVSEDGSVAFRVPARTPIHLQALDANQMAVLTERTLTHVMPGEMRSCVGCHEQPGTAPPVPLRLAASDIHDLTPPVGPSYESGFSFMRTVQPVLDRYCIECHGLNKKIEGDVNLLSNYGKGSSVNGMPIEPRFDNTDSYSSLITLPGLVKMALRKGNAGPESETVSSVPMDYFAHASLLAPMLREGHEDVELDPESMQRIVDWLDMNCIRYGDYARSKIEWRQLSSSGEQELRDYIAECFGEKLASQPIQTLVNVAQIDESRILKGPLPVEEGGWGQIKFIDADSTINGSADSEGRSTLPGRVGAKNSWNSTEDPRYQKMLELIEAALL
jgi:hypothetical protein